jgi:threonine/homoserine/homoserine lactone efflux protein
MEFGVWVAFFTMFLAGGLTPGPAVMLVTTSSIRYGFRPAMAPAVGICVGNVIWVTMAASGASALAHAFPSGFLVLKIAGIAFILWLAWKTAFGEPVDLLRHEPPPRARLFAHGVGLQLANPNALVYFGGLMPAYIDADKLLLPQIVVLLVTVTLTEMFGLVIYATGADALARRFQSKTFAHWFFRIAALTMAASAMFAVYSTWATTGR